MITMKTGVYKDTEKRKTYLKNYQKKRYWKEKGVDISFDALTNIKELLNNVAGIIEDNGKAIQALFAKLGIQA